jgi:predicted methyltransferase
MRISGLRAGAALFGAALILAGCATSPPPPPGIGGVPAHIIAAVSDPGRPPADVARDPALRPADLMAFAGVRPGMRVVDLIPQGGYFTRILSKAIGPRGRVYAYVPDELTRQANREPAVTPITRDPAYANTMLYVRNISDFQVPERLDLIFNGQNYHHMKASYLGPVDMTRFHQQAYAALKPGGIYVVIGFAGAPGSGSSGAETLARVEPAMVRAEALAAGFILTGEATLLADPTDPRNARAEEGVRGRSDQFVYRFTRPR